MDINEFFNKDFSYAIVGASNDEQKYGNKVLKDLKKAGYKTIPINPKQEIIDEQKAYPTVKSYNDKIDVVVFVVPPQVTLKVLQEMPKEIRRVWMQPGSGDDACVQYCNEHNIVYINNACVMVQKPR